MAGVLFLAFAFFTFAQAATVRNGAQSAADAAALAAAQEGRDHLLDGFLGALDEEWQDWLGGEGWQSQSACARAADFAGHNQATVVSCAEADAKPGYTVEVETQYTMGESIIPGTEGKPGRARATAVIEPRCDVDGGSRDGQADVVEFTCDGQDWSIDPELDDLLPEASDLFSVYLED